MDPHRERSRIASDLRPFWPVAVLAAYDSIGFELVGPVLPAIRARAGATPLEASLIFAVFSIGMLARVRGRRARPSGAGAPGRRR